MELDITVLWTEDLCNYLVRALARHLEVLWERSQGHCGHAGLLVLLPFLSWLSVFTDLFPQISGKYTGSRVNVIGRSIYKRVFRRND